MNEKIKELAEEAGFMDIWFSESGDDCEQEIRRFSNLIIKECIKSVEALYILPKEYVVGNYGCAQWWEGYDARGSDSTDAIKKHFGIE